MRGLPLSLFVVLGVALNAQPALAVTCSQQNANELMQRGDVAATGGVDFRWSVPFGNLRRRARVQRATGAR